MDIKDFEKKSVAEIEAQIEKDVNTRDEMNRDLLALNQLRDFKVKTLERQKAVSDFQEKHGVSPDDPKAQIIRPDSMTAGGKASGLGGFFSKLFG